MINATDIRASIAVCYATNTSGLTHAERDAELAYLDALVKDAKRLRALRLASYEPAVKEISEAVLNALPECELESPEAMDAHIDNLVTGIEKAGWIL
jgi:hypothetical protein